MARCGKRGNAMLFGHVYCGDFNLLGGKLQELQISYFPNRYELVPEGIIPLRDELPRGSLDSLLREFGVERHGTPHTAGSDALATLELYFQVTQDGPKRFRSIAYSEASTATSFHTDGTGYSYNYWTEDSQGYPPSDLPSWEEALWHSAEDLKNGRISGQWPLLSTPGPQDVELGGCCATRWLKEPVEQACQPEAFCSNCGCGHELFRNGLWAAMPILVTGTRSTGHSGDRTGAEAECQAPNLVTTGLDGSVLVWAVPVQPATTVVPTVEHITSEMKLGSKLKLCN
ncbi:unnamed protein product [Cladocopium goreaui]|uniref:Non-specific serine/threonine protein kinase n=1 Tax=Cladocopium goreaui TaxID=2562237 RepID=A0A9P1CD59_9DINO|nr:unnamed protein product [Cladocopium goreaui]